ncbi:MAG TPA: serine/threonine-protein kinase [Planctomycetota bacterium]|nr:serine/threonine-protein kinase [Planctomycetota bacterium]
MAGIRDILFGNMAVRAGLITEAQLKECLDFQTAERAAGRTVGRLGELLASRGHLKPEQVQAILDGQASQSGGKFGEIAVRLRLCPASAVEAALKAQKASGGGGKRLGEMLVEAGALRSHHVAAVLECQGLGLEECPGCGQAIAVAKGSSGARCPGCRTALSADAIEEAEPAAPAQPLPEAPAADPEDAEQVAAAAAKPAQAAAFGGYQILAKLGANASGGLYLARKEGDKALVTVKVFSAERSRAKGFAESFAAAARDGAKLRHPGITRVVDVGRDKGRVFCAAEYVEGRSLRSVLASGKPLAVVEALRIAKRVAEILRYAHAQDVFHGDIRPSNIVLTPASAVKLTNFGMVSNPLQNLMALARAAGSVPIYAAPELAIKGAVPTAGNDIYSLGATLYHMIGGRPPHQGASPLETLLRVSQEDPPRPGTLRKGVPEAVDALVMRLLAADPEDRPSDMDAVLREIDAAAEGLGAGQKAAVVAQGAVPDEDEDPEAALAAASRRRTTGWLVVLSILLVFTMVALVLVIIAPTSTRPSDPVKLPTPPATPPKAAQPEPGPRPPLSRPQ